MWMSVLLLNSMTVILWQDVSMFLVALNASVEKDTVIHGLIIDIELEDNVINVHPNIATTEENADTKMANKSACEFSNHHRPLFMPQFWLQASTSVG